LAGDPGGEGRHGGLERGDAGGKLLRLHRQPLRSGGRIAVERGLARLVLVEPLELCGEIGDAPLDALALGG
jgi:hypothetical protein